MLSNYIYHDWPSEKVESQKEVHPYWSFRDAIVVIDEIALMGRRRILQKKAHNQLCINHVIPFTGSTQMLTYEIQLKLPVCIDFQATQPRTKTQSHEIPGMTWESVRADIFLNK